MKVDELKIGDIISYKTDENYIYSKCRIKFINSNKLSIVSIGTMEEHSVPISIRKDQVVSKFEPIPQYKEIPIEKKEIPELKYYCCNCCNKYLFSQPGVMENKELFCYTCQKIHDDCKTKQLIKDFSETASKCGISVFELIEAFKQVKEITGKSADVSIKTLLRKLEERENIKCDVCKEEITFAEPKNIFHVCDKCCEETKKEEVIEINVTGYSESIGFFKKPLKIKICQ